jgi:hypothetical protein
VRWGKRSAKLYLEQETANYTLSHYGVNDSDRLDFNDDESVFFDCEVKYLEIHFCVRDDGLLFDDSHDARFLD